MASVLTSEDTEAESEERPRAHTDLMDSLAALSLTVEEKEE
jgi:hypothetical protein